MAEEKMSLIDSLVFALVCALLTAAAYIIAFGAIYGPFAFATYWFLFR